MDIHIVTYRFHFIVIVRILKVRPVQRIKTWMNADNIHFLKVHDWVECPSSLQKDKA